MYHGMTILGSKNGIFKFMKPITEYQDYRRYMQDYYDERKRVSSFSWREFARSAGFSSPTYLKLVCEGKTRLSLAGAENVGTALHLAGFELDYFKSMLSMAKRSSILNPGYILSLENWPRLCPVQSLLISQGDAAMK